MEYEEDLMFHHKISWNEDVIMTPFKIQLDVSWHPELGGFLRENLHRKRHAVFLVWRHRRRTDLRRHRIEETCGDIKTMTLTIRRGVSMWSLIDWKRHVQTLMTKTRRFTDTTVWREASKDINSPSIICMVNKRRVKGINVILSILFVVQSGWHNLCWLFRWLGHGLFTDTLISSRPAMTTRNEEHDFLMWLKEKAKNNWQQFLCSFFSGLGSPFGRCAESFSLYTLSHKLSFFGSSMTPRVRLSLQSFHEKEGSVRQIRQTSHQVFTELKRLDKRGLR